MNVNKIIKEMRQILNTKESQLSDEEVIVEIENYLFKRHEGKELSYKQITALVDRVFCAMRKDLDILDKYVEDPDISEIMVNGKDNIFVERKGNIEKVHMSFETVENLEEVIRRVSSKVHREINELSPIVDARLDNGSRVNAVYKNVALNGPILTIRKFPSTAFKMEDLIRFETLTYECAEYLKKLVEAGYNCFISGGTSSGKTTFLNVLTNYIPKHERVVVIEDSAELQITKLENIVRMECKNANGEGKGKILMQDLIKTSLRMRPDRIIVGEVRGKEVMDMINAMNTGHDGSLSTGHGNNIEGMIRRLESMFLQAVDFPIDAVRSQIAEGIDIIIHLGRLPDRSRRVLEIAEIEKIVDGNIVTNSLFKFKPDQGLKRTNNQLINREKLELRGINSEHRI